MFVKKQRAAEREERKRHTLPGRGRQLSGGPSSPNKPMQPEYLKSSMPIRQPALFQQDQQQPAYRPVQAPPQQQSYQTAPPRQFNHVPPPQPKNRGKLSLKMPASPVSPPKPRRSFSQVSQSPISPQPPITQKPPIFRQMSSGSGSAVLNMTTPPANQSGVYEIPVRHVSPPKPQQSSQDWHNVKPSRDQINYRPPMSIQVPSYNQQERDDGSSPRVVITSNSPRSPQKAYYVGEGDAGTGPNWPPPRRASIAVASPGRILMMSGANNKPRRRASYAEITLSNNSSGSYNSLPRNFSVGRSYNAYNNQPGNSNPAFPQRSVIQVMSSPTLLDDGIELFPRQRRYGPPNVRSPQYYHTPQQQAAQPERGFARINMRAASVDRLLYQPAGHHAARQNRTHHTRRRTRQPKVAERHPRRDSRVARARRCAHRSPRNHDRTGGQQPGPGRRNLRARPSRNTLSRPPVRSPQPLRGVGRRHRTPVKAPRRRVAARRMLDADRDRIPHHRHRTRSC